LVLASLKQNEISEYIEYLTEDELAELDALIGAVTSTLWQPHPDNEPQRLAYECQADELYYGGSAGGGKTDLLLGLAMTQHTKSIIFRREFSQLTDAILRSFELLGDTPARYNGSSHIWKNVPGERIIEFAGCQHLKDLQKYKGRPHDLKCFDEVADLNEHMYLFLTGWARTTAKNQRVRVVAAGNPPLTQEGEWVKRRWAAWLDPAHKNPAAPGELRWYARVDDEDIELKSGKPFKHGKEIIIPRTRTFIPAKLEDNPYLSKTGYRSILQNLPEPMRSKLLYGDHSIEVADDPFQVIPTEWVRLAQKRWENTEQPKCKLTALGCDIARGGKDNTVIYKRFKTWFDKPNRYPGKATPNGQTAAALIIEALDRKKALINLDVIGIGSSVYDILEEKNYNVNGVNFAGGSNETDKSGKLTFRNKRAEYYWAMREALDPETGEDLALPPDPILAADLCAPRWKLTASGIQIESKDDIIKRLGRSPDDGDACVLAHHFEKEIVIVREL